MYWQIKQKGPEEANSTHHDQEMEQKTVTYNLRINNACPCDLLAASSIRKYLLQMFAKGLYHLCLCACVCMMYIHSCACLNSCMHMRVDKFFCSSKTVALMHRWMGEPCWIAYQVRDLNKENIALCMLNYLWLQLLSRRSRRDACLPRRDGLPSGTVTAVIFSSPTIAPGTPAPLPFTPKSHQPCCESLDAIPFCF